MTWLLILKLSTMTDPVAIGMFYDRSMCELAGNGMGLQIQRAEPHVSVTYHCAYVGDDA